MWILLWVTAALANDLIIDGTTMTSHGLLDYDTIHVINGGVLQVTPHDAQLHSGTLRLQAGHVYVDATSSIDGSGAGYPGMENARGDGPGGGEGGSTVADAGGGGAYGGSGGYGVMDNNVTIDGMGGAAYADPWSLSVLMGSAGGAAGSMDGDYGGYGGAGGASVEIFAETIEIEGEIVVDGQTGILYNNDAAGGGAGGGVMLRADSLICTGWIWARGGDGAQIDDRGGGGGGGVVKQFHDAPSSFCDVSVVGGWGPGSAEDGENGIDTIASVDWDGDGYTWALGDCDTLDPLISPVAVEICDGKDNNCDGVVDEMGTNTYYLDIDGDGFGDNGWTIVDCAQPSGYAIYPDDCDDHDATRFPGNPEVCDGVDNDCDLEIDDGLIVSWYPDEDADGYGVSALATESCLVLDGHSRMGGDCDDAEPVAFPGNPEVCDLTDNNCDGAVDEGVTIRFWQDVDGDGFGDPLMEVEACERPEGFSDIEGDCDDQNAVVFPGNPEVCDGLDNNCNGQPDELVTDTFFEDVDGDGAGNAGVAVEACEAPVGFVFDSYDCNDNDADIRPGLVEWCDGKDNNCSGEVDEGLLLTFFRDADGDGYGDLNHSEEACELSFGWSAMDNDCDDSRFEVHPGAPEVCDEIDNDCDLLVDDADSDSVGDGTYFQDADDDGFGNSLVSAMGCGPPIGFVVPDTDCADDDPDRFPGASELPYDGIDQDCDGTDLTDVDGDGHEGGPGGSDCNDFDVAVNPQGVEDADGVDDDCDGVVDEGTEHSDEDGDGFTEMGGDCNDANPLFHPAAAEICDGLDQDCDGQVDEGTSCTDDDGDGFCEHSLACADGSTPGDCHDGDPLVHPLAIEDPPDGIDSDCDGIVDGGDPDPDGDGFTEEGGDCEPEDATVNPTAVETIDGVDEDCDGIIDEDTSIYDDDGDGWTETQGDCDDTNDEVHPDAIEILNGRDDDCDGVLDEGSSQVDDDGDGFVDDAGDCDDTDPYVHPGAPEYPNGIDDDCDGLVDEGLTDADGDGFSVADGDCDDHDGWAHPSHEEVCDGIDNNCDGLVDDGCFGSEMIVEETESRGCAATGTLSALGWWMLPIVWRRRSQIHRIRCSSDDRLQPRWEG